MRRLFRKPLMVFESKQLFKDTRATSTIAEFEYGSRFHEIYGETYPNELESPDKIEKVVMCSG